MNLLNRIIVTFLFLALIAGAISIIALTWTIPQDTINGLRDAVNWLDDNNQDLEKTVLTAAAVLVALVSLIIVVLELTPKSGSEVKVTDLQAGDAVLSTAAIAQRIEEAVSQVPHVSEAKATVRARRKGIQLGLELHVDPEANLANVTDEACQAAQDVLTNRVHVALAAPPRVRLHYRELRLRRPTALEHPAGSEPATEAPVEDALPPSDEHTPVEIGAAASQPSEKERRED